MVEICDLVHERIEKLRALHRASFDFAQREFRLRRHLDNSRAEFATVVYDRIAYEMTAPDVPEHETRQRSEILDSNNSNDVSAFA